jgi:hypothetical protein
MRETSTKNVFLNSERTAMKRFSKDVPDNLHCLFDPKRFSDIKQSRTISARFLPLPRETRTHGARARDILLRIARLFSKESIYSVPKLMDTETTLSRGTGN